MRIAQVVDLETLERGAELFDERPDRDGASRFLNTPGHHLLFAFEDERPVGFASGAELIHPDKGAEMYLNELGVDEAYQGRGIACLLLRHLVRIARENGVSRLEADVLAANQPMLTVFRRSGLPMQRRSEDSVIHVTLSLVAEERSAPPS